MKKILNFLFIVAPIIGIYKIPGTSVSLENLIFLLLFNFSFFSILARPSKGALILTKPIKMYIIYIAYALVILNFNTLFFQLESSFSYLYHVLLMFYLILFFRKQIFDPIICYKYYKILTLISCCLVLIQFIVYKINGQMLFMVPKSMIRHTIGEPYRPAALFLEPTHFANYAVIFLILSMFSQFETKKSKIVPVFVVSSLFFCGSSSSFVYILVYIFLLFVSLKNGIKKTVLLVLIVSAAFLVFAIERERVMFTINHLIEMDTRHLTSGGVKVLRGFIIYSLMPTNLQIFGGGLGCTSQIINKYNIHTIFDPWKEPDSPYISAMSELLTSGGILGTIVFLSFLGILFFSKSFCSKALVIIYLFMMSANEVIYNDPFVIIIMFAICEVELNSKRGQICVVNRKFL